MATMDQIVSAAVESQQVQAVFSTHLPGPGHLCVGCARIGQTRPWPCAHAEAARAGAVSCQGKIADIHDQIVRLMAQGEERIIALKIDAFDVRSLTAP